MQSVYVPSIARSIPAYAGEPPPLLPQAGLPQRSIPAYAGEPDGGWYTPIWHGLYPRVCGGTIIGVIDNDDNAALSPRMRGNPLMPAVVGFFDGSIPAYAGEPGLGNDELVQPQLYPRVCGGTGMSFGLPEPSIALSPRMRGNPPPPPADGLDRSIPAYAGEPPLPPSRWAGPVYPRVCGGTRPIHRG